MKTDWKILFFSLLLLGGGMAARAQPNGGRGYDSIWYNQRDGLANNGVLKIIRDQQGFIWISQSGAISRWDGRLFTNYGRAEGIMPGARYNIDTDYAGRLWVAAYEFDHLFYYTGGKPSAFVPGYMGRDMYVRPPSFFSFLYKAPSIRKVPGIPVLPLGSTLADSHGYTYTLCMDKRIYIMKDFRLVGSVAEPPYVSEDGSIYFFRKMEKDSRGDMYYNVAGIWRLSGTPPYLVQCPDPPGPDVHYSYSVLPSDTGIIFQWLDKRWQPAASIPAGITNSKLLALQNGNLLMSADGYGLLKYIPRQYSAYKFDPVIHYYASRSDGTVAIFNDSSLLHHAPLAAFCKKMAGHKPQIFKSRDGTLWVLTVSGLYYFLKGGATISKYDMPQSVVETASFSGALETKEGVLRFLSFNGFIRYENGKFHQQLIEGAAKNYSIEQDSAGNFFEGTRTSLFTERKGVLYNISAVLGPGDHFINEIRNDGRGNIWVNETAQNIVYKIAADRKGNYYKADSLVLSLKNSILNPEGLAFDHKENMWVSTYGSVTVYLLQFGGRYDPDKKIVMVSKAFADKTVPQKIWADSNRTRIYSSYFSFDADRIIAEKNTVPPRTVLTDVLLFNKGQDWQSRGNKIDINGIPFSLQLTSRENTISFSFTGIVNTAGSDVQYRWQLKGQDRDWQSATDEAKVTYTNLVPGDYTFLVKAGDINELWSEPLAFSFTINPPWYRTTLAYIIWGLLLVFTVYSIILLRVRYVRRNLRTERLLIEHELKALRAQINPHFLQNSMEFLIQSIHNDSSGDIEKIVRQLSVYLRNMLYLSDKNVVRLEDELIFSEEYLAINKMLFHDSFTYNIITDPEVDTFATKVPSMLLQPFLENAVKHGILYVKEGKLITMSVTTAKGNVYCTISNPVPEVKMQKKSDAYVSKGIAITEERLGLLFPGQKKEPFIKCTVADGIFTVVICIPG